jgi:hypothetical protein
MDYTAYQEGSFSTTIKTLQSQVTDLHKQNLGIARQLQQASASLQSLKSENIALRNKLMTLGAGTVESKLPSDTQLLNEVGEQETPTTESTKKTTSKKTLLNE